MSTSEHETQGQCVWAEIISTVFQLSMSLLLSPLQVRLMGDWSTTSQYQKAFDCTIKDQIKWCPDKLT